MEFAANGEEFDGDLYATKAQLDALADESALTDWTAGKNYLIRTESCFREK